MRKVRALFLSAVLLFSCTVTAFAKTTYRNGTYNGYGYGTTDTCQSLSFYSQTGSDSDYYLKTSVTYYYLALFGGSLRQLTVSSGSQKKSAEVSGSDGNYTIKYITGDHYVNGSLVESVTVYA